MLRDLIHHPHVPYSIIVDIGSGSVGVGIIETDNTEKKPLIIYTYREKVRNPKDHSPEEYLRALKEALLTATLELTSNGLATLATHHRGAMVEDIRVLYAAPWSELVTRKISLEKKEPFRATQDVVNTLVREALTQVDSKHHENIIFEQSGLEVVHEELADARLNGYPVTDFHGQECVTIDVVHMSELVPRAVRATLMEAGKNLLPHPTITERSFSRVVAGVVRTVFPHTDSFLSIEMTGGGTELTLVEEGVLRENISTPTGAYAFELEIAEHLDTIVSEVQGHIHDYVSHTTRDDVTVAITEARDAYKKVISKLLSDLQSRTVIPIHLITLADREYRDLFLTIAEETFSLVVPDYTTRTIDQQLLEPYVEYAPNTEKDQYLSMIALFFHTNEKNEKRLSHE